MIWRVLGNSRQCGLNFTVGSTARVLPRHLSTCTYTSTTGRAVSPHTDCFVSNMRLSNKSWYLASSPKLTKTLQVYSPSILLNNRLPTTDISNFITQPANLKDELQPPSSYSDHTQLNINPEGGSQSVHGGFRCSSVLKKRRRKMNRHKHLKRRKKQKFMRRALGK